eukprot:2327211-Pyramimonas_sp.AAC.1
MARSRSGPRGASPCRTPQQASKEATVSQIAAPQRWRGLIWARAWRHCAGPSPAGIESGDRFADRSPPGMARVSLGPRVASLCWAPQQASKVATASQIAASQRWRGLI